MIWTKLPILISDLEPVERTERIDNLNGSKHLIWTKLADLGNPEPVDHEEGRERAERLIEAVETLSARQKQALILHYGNGISIRMTAEHMGIGKMATESHIRRGLERLKIHYGAS